MKRIVLIYSRGRIDITGDGLTDIGRERTAELFRQLQAYYRVLGRVLFLARYDVPMYHAIHMAELLHSPHSIHRYSVLSELPRTLVPGDYMEADTIMIFDGASSSAMQQIVETWNTFAPFFGYLPVTCSWPPYDHHLATVLEIDKRIPTNFYENGDAAT